jgi:glutamyl/glutaminyl-tRNA synthetase
VTTQRKNRLVFHCVVTYNLSARAQQGIWRVRIEDIDPPREVPGAASRILHQLELNEPK